MVLVREPRDAIVSLMIRNESVQVREGLLDYIAFYSRILPYSNGFIVATFEQVTKDCGSVIRRLNERFGTAFQEFAHTPENVQKCYLMVERDNERESRGTGHVEERAVARPSVARDIQRDKMLGMLSRLDVEPQMAQAEGLCRRFMQLAMNGGRA